MKRHLLIVDDSPVIRVLLAEVLAGDYYVATAGDGLGALELLLAGEPCDAVILDLSMPRMDGIELLRRLRALPAFAHLPVIVVSGHYESVERMAAIEAGASDFLTKPFNPVELQLRLRRLLPADHEGGLAQVVKLRRARALAS